MAGSVIREFPPPSQSSEKIKISAVFRSLHLASIKLCSRDSNDDDPSLFDFSISKDRKCMANSVLLDRGDVSFYDMDVEVADPKDYPYGSDFELFAVP